MESNIFDPSNTTALHRDLQQKDFDEGALADFTRGLFGDPGEDSLERESLGNLSDQEGADDRMDDDSGSAANPHQGLPSPASGPNPGPRVRMVHQNNLSQREQRSALKKFADILKLSRDSVDKATNILEHTRPGEEFVAFTALSLHVVERVEQAHRHSGRWSPSKKLQKLFNQECMKAIWASDLGAFSRTLTDDHRVIVSSLEYKMMHMAHHQEPEFYAENYPSDYAEDDDSPAARAVNFFVKDVLRNCRAKTRAVLLTNILKNKNKKKQNKAVPDCKTLTGTVCQMFLIPKSSTNSPLVLDKAKQAQQIRTIFMRYVTANIYMNPKVNKRHCQWIELDRILASLERESDKYKRQYLRMVVARDSIIFDGKRTWAQVLASDDKLKLPTRAEVCAAIGEPYKSTNEALDEDMNELQPNEQNGEDDEDEEDDQDDEGDM